MEKVATYDTAGSAKMISEGNMTGCGAIASDLAAEAWGMSVVASNIEDDSVNFTRFLLLGRQASFNPFQDGAPVWGTNCLELESDLGFSTVPYSNRVYSLTTYSEETQTPPFR